MAFGHAIQQRMKELQAKTANARQMLIDAQRAAIEQGVQKAKDMTPPNEDTPLRGTNTISSALKERWATDSVKEPQVNGNELSVALANELEYASYVNDGHRMSEHFVPGLTINESSGLLEMGPEVVNGKKVGIMVGTQTEFVPGLYMTQTAAATYRRVVEEELHKRAKEMLE
jgi:hypothetical protein